MIDEKNCKNISAQIVETEKDISAQDVADVIRYLRAAGLNSISHHFIGQVA